MLTYNVIYYRIYVYLNLPYFDVSSVLELNPMPTDNVVQVFNDLRQDIVLLYELKLALANCEYELQTLRHRFETLAPGKVKIFKKNILKFPVNNGNIDH